MRAIVMNETGGPEVLVLQDVPKPEPAEGQVLVHVDMIGVNFVETQIRSGTFPPPPLPTVFGFEAAGTIVDGAQAGTRVVATSEPLGAYAEYLAVAAGSVYPIPDGLTSEAALAVSMHGAVASALLDAARLDGSETILIEAAGTGIGAYLVQLAKHAGVRRIIASAGTAQKRALAQALGADEVIDHSQPDWPAKVAGIDVVFESIGGDTAARLLDAMTPLRGRMLYYGLLSGQPPQISAHDLLMRGLTVTGCGGPDWLERVAAARPAIHELAATGAIRPLVGQTLALEQAAEAHRIIEDHQATGKVLLVP